MDASVAERVTAIKARLTVPAIAAPMFLISNPEMVIAACKAGIVGSFPTTNARTPEILDQWLARIASELGRVKNAAPWAVNMIVHKTAARFDTDFAAVLRYKPEIVITAVGSPARVTPQVHAYGGLVFADVNTVPYARKAVEAGADGLVILTAGAGGHTGWLNPFAFVPAVREFFDGPIVLAGGIMDGAGIRAAEVMGADFAYLGTRFIATPESAASDAYRKLLIEATEEDIVLTAGLTGIPANFIRQSIVAAGLDPVALASRSGHDFSTEVMGPAWKEIWSAGHGVRAIKAVEPIADIVARLRAEYVAAHARP